MLEDQKPKLIANRWIAPDGYVLQSKHRHDFVVYGDCFVDGGLDYCRIGGDLEDFCVYSDDPHEAKRKAFKWCTYGKDGKSIPKWITPAQMEEDHIWAILKTQGESLPEHIYDMFLDEIKFRKGTLATKEDLE